MKALLSDGPFAGAVVDVPDDTTGDELIEMWNLAVVARYRYTRTEEKQADAEVWRWDGDKGTALSNTEFYGQST